MKVVVVSIGDELLNGQTINTNAAYIGQVLNDIGVDINKVIAIGDSESEIVNTLKQYGNSADLIITTGGLGPTRDDITKKALASFLSVPMIFMPDMYKNIQDYFEKLGRPTTDLHRAQCFLPKSCDLIENNYGSAPGMWMKASRARIMSLPGVPYEMKGILQDGGLKLIKALKPADSSVCHYILQTTGRGETEIAGMIEALVRQFPEHISIAYLPGLASVKLRITGRGESEGVIFHEVQKWGERIRNLLGNIVYGIGEISLPKALGDLCNSKNVAIGTAESCTGGYISHLITAIPGSSNYYQGSILSYSNHIKSKLLGVSNDTLRIYGAVSENTVIEMVAGAIKALDVDIAVAVSGIAGPSGGTPDKPVGTVWIAVGNQEITVTKKIQLARNRALNIKYAAIRALDEMRLFLIEHYS